MGTGPPYLNGTSFSSMACVSGCPAHRVQGQIPSPTPEDLKAGVITHVLIGWTY